MVRVRTAATTAVIFRVPLAISTSARVTPDTRGTRAIQRVEEVGSVLSATTVTIPPDRSATASLTRRAAGAALARRKVAFPLHTSSW